MAVTMVGTLNTNTPTFRDKTVENPRQSVVVRCQACHFDPRSHLRARSGQVTARLSPDTVGFKHQATTEGQHNAGVWTGSRTIGHFTWPGAGLRLGGEAPLSLSRVPALGAVGPGRIGARSPPLAGDHRPTDRQTDTQRISDTERATRQ